MVYILCGVVHYQVLPNYTMVSQFVFKEQEFRLTFSMPYNLSLPSSLAGPASASRRSRGVGRGAFGSRFEELFAFVVAELLYGFCVSNGFLKRLDASADSGAVLGAEALTADALNLLRKDDMLVCK